MQKQLTYLLTIILLKLFYLIDAQIYTIYYLRRFNFTTLTQNLKLEISMEKLISQITGNLDSSDEQAKDAIAIIFNFLQTSGPTDQVNKIFESLPGATDIAKGYDGNGDGSLMGAYNELTALGLGMGDVQSLAKIILNYLKENADENLVDEVITAIPGLSQFV